MARGPGRKIPAAVLTTARKVALASKELKGAAAPDAPTPRRPTRDKVIAALKRLHPMD